MKTIIKISSLIFLLILLGSCGINSNMMFKTPKDGSFIYDSIPLVPKEDYKLSIDDKLTFNLSTNNGKGLIEGISGTSTSIGNMQGRGIANGGASGQNEYVVRSDGKVELPVLGDVKIQGLTIKQCEDTLEQLFKDQYQDPFIQLNVTNRRCVVFSGDGNAATIVNLENVNTSLLEVLAQTGGISERGKSRIVKVMRKMKDGSREIYHIDVSTIDGLKYADMIIQGNDYIYVEPRPEIIKGAIKEWAPIASLASSITLIFTILRFTN